MAVSFTGAYFDGDQLSLLIIFSHEKEYNGSYFYITPVTILPLIKIIRVFRFLFKTLFSPKIKIKNLSIHVC